MSDNKTWIIKENKRLMTKNVSCICFEYFSNYFLIHIFFISDDVSLKINWHYFDNFSFSWFVCIDQFSKWKTKFILSEKQLESGSKNVLLAICAKWYLIGYPFKYYVITKLWTGKNILCYSWTKLYCAGEHGGNQKNI